MASVTQRSFSLGEVRPQFHGRSDRDEYAHAVKRASNFIVTKDGALQKRPGTEFIAELGSRAVERRRRLIPFVFSDAQSYVLVLEAAPEGGEGWLYVYFRGERVPYDERAWLGTGLTTPVGTVVRHPYPGGPLYRCTTQHISGDYEPGVTPGWQGYWALEPDPFVRVPHPYTEAQLFELQWAQSGDVLTLVHPAHPRRELRRLDHGEWRAAEITSLVPNVSAYVPKNLALPTPSQADEQFYPAKPWTWAVHALVHDEHGGLAEMRVGGQISSSSYGLHPNNKPVELKWEVGTTPDGGLYGFRVYRGRHGAYGLVGTVEATSFLDEGHAPDLSQQPPWPLNESALAPQFGAVAYHEQRLVLAGSDREPSTVYASRAGEFASFSTNRYPVGALPANLGLSLRLAARDLQQVRAMVSKADSLLVLTSSAEWDLRLPASAGDTGSARIRSRNGSGRLPPLEVGDSVLFVGAHHDAVYELAFSQEGGGWVDRELSYLATHLLEGHRIVDWAYQERPESIVWMVRDDGVLLGLTYSRANGILAWHRHQTYGKVRSVCAVPEGQWDALYLVIERQLVTAEGDAWDAGTGYPVGAVARHHGQLYRNLVDDNTGREPGLEETAGYWQRLPGHILERLTFHPLAVQDPETLEVVEDVRQARHLDCSTVIGIAAGSLVGWDGRNRNPHVKLRLTYDAVAEEYLVEWVRDDDGLLLGLGPGTPIVFRPRGGPPIVVEVAEVVSAYSARVRLSDNPGPLLGEWTHRWEVLHDWLGGLARFDGDAATNGLPAPMMVMSDGHPVEVPVVGAVTPGFVEGVPHGAVLYAGLPFTAEAEFLDAVYPGQNTGLAKRATRRIGFDLLGYGVPAMGDSLQRLNPEKQDPRPTRDFRPLRRQLDQHIRHEYAVGAGGALRQRLPYPLTVLGLLREVEHGGK